MASIAARYGVTRTAVSHIIKRNGGKTGRLSRNVPKHERLLGFIRLKYGAGGPAEIAKFAAAINMSEGAIKKYIYLARKAPYDTRKRIAKLTNGRVGLDDW